jgi:hypothetical protein
VHELFDLMVLFDFTADDLAANRAGQLTNRQRERIEAERLNASIEKAAATAALASFGILMLLYFAVAYPLGNALGPWTLVFIAIWLALAVVAANLVRRALRRRLRQSARDRSHWLLRRLGRLDAAGDQRAAEGQVSRFAGVLTQADDSEHPLLLLNGEVFQADPSSADQDERLWQLEMGASYAFYAVPEVLWIVAAEPLATPDRPQSV